MATVHYMNTKQLHRGQYLHAQSEVFMMEEKESVSTELLDAQFNNPSCVEHQS